MRVPGTRKWCKDHTDAPEQKTPYRGGVLFSEVPYKEAVSHRGEAQRYHSPGSWLRRTLVRS